MSEKAIWIIKVRGKEMEKNFEKIIKEGTSIDDNLKTELSKKIPNIEEFIENGKIRFWRFIKGKSDWVFPKMGDYVLFEVEKEHTVYITLSSNTIEDGYDKTVKNYKLLRIPNPTIYNPQYKSYTKFPKAFLVKLLGNIKNTELLEKLRKLCTCEEFSHALVYCGKCPEEAFNLLLSSLGEEKAKSTSVSHENSTALILTGYFQSKGYHFPDYLIAQFYTALKTKGFVILSGLTGTGKTKIAQELAELLDDSKNNLLFLSVRPDWRDSKPLVGYYNPLTGEYHKTPLLEFILRAKEDYEQNRENAMPYFIILDEMNLAHVEYYFADFLSVLESGRDDDGFTRESIKLHDNDAVETFQGIPKELKLPSNLYIVGTVNMDETTYSFSPKVLDRAFVVEFHDVELEEYPPERINLSEEEVEKLRNAVLDDLRGEKGKFLARSKEEINKAVRELKDTEYWRVLVELNKALEPYDMHFGYRVVDEIALFFINAKESWKVGIIEFENNNNENKVNNEIFDLALLMKVLPKFHGNRKKLEEPLKAVLKLCLSESAGIDVQELRKENVIELLKNWEKEKENFRFKHTARKVLRMLRQLYEIGFASFS